MPECTEAERALVEVAIKALCDEPSASSDALGLQGQAFGIQRLPETLVAAIERVVLERITPEVKEWARHVFVDDIRLHREKAKLRDGIPSAIWKKLVEEVYPREATDA